ncbi:MAG: FAD-dependent oxidoreductase [Saprospiraceae bacterium]|nr:MAG: FAD-dependent oxidoreductase [Saprospiraceae bacterium]
MSTLQQTYPLSYWEREVFFKDIDVIIIGSGIVGLSAALSLKEKAPKLKVVVLERGSLPIGASTRNAGFACFGSMTELLDDLESRPEQEVWGLVERRWQGLARLRKRIGDEVMRYEEVGGFELFRPGEEAAFEKCLENRQVFNQRLKEITGHPEVFKAEDRQINNFGFKGVKHLIENQVEGVIHTGKMMEALLKKSREAGIQLFNGVGVETLELNEPGVRLKTEQGWSINAQQVLVATNGFAATMLPELAVKPARNQVIITHPLQGLPFRGGFHYDRGYIYFREIDGRVLLGGGRHLDLNGESTTDFGETDLIQEHLLRLLNEVILPGRSVSIDQTWSGIMGVGQEKAPILKRLNEGVVVAVRLGGMGVAIGSLVGEEAAEMVIGGESDV